MRKKVFMVYLLCSLLVVLSPLAVSCTEEAAPSTPATVTTTQTATQSSTATVTTTATATATVVETKVVKPIELKFIVLPSSKNVMYQKLFEPWINEVYERSGGRVSLQPCFANQLCPAAENYNAVSTKLADMGCQYTALTAGRFTCVEVIQLPKPDVELANLSPIAWELYQAFPEAQAQFSDTKVLSMFALALPYMGAIATIDKPVRTLEDMKGLKLAAGGTWTSKTIGMLGASPMQVYSGDIYMNLQKKVIDGARIDLGQLEEGNFQEVVNYCTLVNTGFVPFFFSMNLDTWASLPSDMQKLLEEMTGEYWTTKVDDYSRSHGQEALDNAVAKYGLEVIKLTDAEKARWGEVTSPVRDEYVASLDKAGLPGKQLLAKLDELFLKYSK